MPIERLEFDNPQIQYHPMEVGIHVTRYQLAKPFVAGKRVLDIACGEGYGSWLLKAWGAASVLGVDISEDAIASAKKNFASEGINFLCADAANFSEEATFDVIISLETIEHVADPNAFLIQLKRVLSPNGIILISCPNDRSASFTTYYPGVNPYHLREYTFKKFMEESETVLGKASAWLLGTNVFGYGNFRYIPEEDSIEWSKSSLLVSDLTILKDSDMIFCHNYKDNLPKAENSIYYVGIWGISTEEHLVSGTLFPIKPFNACINSIKENLANEQKNSLKKDRLIFTLQQRTLMSKALLTERELMQESLNTYIRLLTEAQDRIKQIEAELKKARLVNTSLRSVSLQWITSLIKKIFYPHASNGF